jgi:long-chain fatty acid transport protein
MRTAFGGGVAALMLTTTMAHAVGLDRSGQDISVIFEDGGYAELSFGYITPSVTGTEYPLAAGAPGAPVDNVGNAYSSLSLAIKMDVNENLSFGLIMDQPYGVDVSYGGDPATTRLGGTSAELSSRAITAIARYQFNDNFSAHAGLRRQTLQGDVTLSGIGFGGLSGYNVTMDDGVGTGWLAGVAYERPDIALRVALTYHAAITNTFDQTETINGIPISALPAAVNPLGLDGLGELEVVSPEAWNLDFQTGIAANTLLFGSIRYAAYEETILSPEYFDIAVDPATPGSSITDIDSGFAYSLGVGRRFSDVLSGSLSAGWEPEGSDDLVSPLSPTNGNTWVAIGAQYTMGDVILSGGVRYTWLGDARPETGTPDVPHADFTGNSALAVGMSVAYRF